MPNYFIEANVCDAMDELVRQESEPVSQNEAVDLTQLGRGNQCNGLKRNKLYNIYIYIGTEPFKPEPFRFQA